MTPEEVALALRKDRFVRTGAGKAFDPDVPPTETELNDARAFLALVHPIVAGAGVELQRLKGLPQWQQRKPPVTDRLYLGWSDLPERAESPVSLYAWTGECFQHFLGGYDGAVTHWMITDVPCTPPNPEPADES